MADMTHTGALSPTAPRPRKPIKLRHIVDHAVLIAGALFMVFPVALVLMTTSFEDVDIVKNGLQVGLEGKMLENFEAAMFEASGFSKSITGTKMLINSLILGFGFAIGKIAISMMAAYAIVYFRLRFATFAFWIIFTTLLLPLEVRILPSYEAIQSLGLANTYTGLIVPLIAVHLFVCYFGLMADVTPPVGRASFAAAAVSGGDPIRTGFVAFFYSLRTALLPFLFIFNTDLLLIDVTFMEGVIVFIVATAAILVFTAGAQGVFLVRSRLWESMCGRKGGSHPAW